MYLRAESRAHRLHLLSSVACLPYSLVSFIASYFPGVSQSFLWRNSHWAHPLLPWTEFLHASTSETSSCGCSNGKQTPHEEGEILESSSWYFHRLRDEVSFFPHSIDYSRVAPRCLLSCPSLRGAHEQRMEQSITYRMRFAWLALRRCTSCISRFLRTLSELPLNPDAFQWMEERSESHIALKRSTALSILQVIAPTQRRSLSCVDEIIADAMAVSITCKLIAK